MFKGGINCILLGVMLAVGLGLAQPPLVGEENVVNIGSDRQLFVDKFWIENERGVSLRLHSPTPREVVWETNEPWEGETSSYSVVIEDDGLYAFRFAQAAPWALGPPCCGAPNPVSACLPNARTPFVGGLTGFVLGLL